MYTSRITSQGRTADADKNVEASAGLPYEVWTENKLTFVDK